MKDISIFCKSYRDDLERAVSLVETVRKFDRDSLALYISVPKTDLASFKARIGMAGVNWLSDEDVIAANPAIDPGAYSRLPGQLCQQIVKAEFWRVNPAENYLCVDSDSRFIREFCAADFLSPDGAPYTVLHEGKAILESFLLNGIDEALRAFEAAARQMQEKFSRTGPLYNFGPFPVVWSAKVWRALLSRFEAEGTTILDAIVAHPHESSWYGEALLKYKPIELLPRDPIFKAYLYIEDFDRDRSAGIDEKALARFYLGVVYQSNWYPKRLQPLKRFAYKVKRKIRRWRHRT